MNETPKAKKLRLQMEDAGYKNVKVWWEPLGMAMEMCGPSGGWMSESTSGIWPLGLSFAEAEDWIESRSIPRT